MKIRVERTCRQCGVVFLTDLRHVKRRKVIYCDIHCSNKGRISSLRGTKNPNAKNNLQIFKKGNIPWNKGIKGCFDENVLNKIRVSRMKQIIPTSDTNIERLMRNELDRREIEYISQYNLGGKFLIDFAIPELLIAIECDGDYWHSLSRNKHYDKLKNEYCASHCWKLFRFGEREIIENVSGCVESVLGEINARKQEVVLCEFP